MSDQVSALVIGGNDFPFHRLAEMWPHIDAALEAEGIDTDVTTEKERLADLPESEYDVLVDYTTDSTLSDAQRTGLLSFVEEGGGYAGIHAAAVLTTVVPSDPTETVAHREEPFPELRTLLGGYFLDHPEQCAFDVNVVNTHHPITLDIDDFRAYDEPYNVVTDDVTVLARMDHPTLGDTPVAWVREHGDGRVFYTSLGHTPTSFEGEARSLLGAGVRWAGRGQRE